MKNVWAASVLAEIQNWGESSTGSSVVEACARLLPICLTILDSDSVISVVLSGCSLGTAF
jgi:hypothetical protein